MRVERDGRACQSEPDDGRRLTPGQLVRRRLLGTDALYRIVGENKCGVEVEVVQVEGLEAGSRFTFALTDVRSMEVVDNSGGRPGTNDSPANRG